MRTGERVGATPVVAQRSTTSAPAAKKPKLRRSSRKRPAKPPQLKAGDTVEGKFGPLVGSVADGKRRHKSLLNGVIVAEAGGKKNSWHVRWEGVDAAFANSRDQKATAGGISSTRLVHVFDSSSSDDDSGGDEYSDESEKDEGIGSSESDNEDDEEGGSNSGSDDELPTADVHLHKRQNSDYYLGSDRQDVRGGRHRVDMRGGS